MTISVGIRAKHEKICDYYVGGFLLRVVYSDSVMSVDVGFCFINMWNGYGICGKPMKNFCFISFGLNFLIGDQCIV